jgi:hypothetical protein
MADPIQTKTANKTIFKVVPEKVRTAAIKDYQSSSLWNKKENKDAVFNESFFTLTEIRTLEKLMNVIYPLAKYTPPQMKEANDDLIDVGTIVKYHPRDLASAKKEMALAFVNRVGKNLFKIFINEDCEDESFDSMDLHEKGHILFNHTQSVKFYIEEFRAELEKIWDTRLMKYFEEEVKKNPKNKDKIVKLLFREFSNIAQDMEINSKLFDDDDGWFKAKKTLSRSSMIVHLKAIKREMDDLSGMFKNKNITDPHNPEYLKILRNFEIIRQNIKTRLEGEEGDFVFCYPGNKGWPCKLDWMTYMILLVKDLDETMKQVIKNVKAALGAGNGNGGGQPISQGVLDAYSQQADAGDAAAGEGDGDSEGESEDETEVTPNGRSQGGRGRGRSHGTVQVEFEMCNNFDDFTKFLRKTCIGKKNRKWNSNPLYNSNRSKFAGRVVVPRRHLIEKWMPQSATFIIDISGSVNSDLVEKAINSIIDSNSGIDLKESHIIFCDTRVSSDEIMSKRTKKIYSGGGTEIANGIKYVAEKGYCKKATDYLFVISDFQDNLSSWNHEAEKIHCQRFAVGYGYDNKEQAKGIFEYSNRGSGSFNEAWNRLWKTIFIMADTE